jgi:hypothetical protein
MRVELAEVPAAKEVGLAWQGSVDRAIECLQAARDRMSLYFNIGYSHPTHLQGQQVPLLPSVATEALVYTNMREVCLA